jgi:formate dehydrogenase subunit gamma
MTVDIDTLRDIAAAHKDIPGGLLPALHAIQDEFGHVPPEGVPAIAGEFNLSRAEVHGVITYYHHFRSTPPAGQVVQICRAEACKAMGADALVAHVEQRLGCTMHGHSSDGSVTLEPVYCLGLCAQSPSMMIGDELHARVTPQRFDELMAEIGSAA